ncbi:MULTISPECIES: NepR family anti-sigma factor [unclassified Roseitalea]|uniref:NepR family anti-sigma factor n=1 Tax=unclassified Roseitalea TaxID=2639107 RepID=UPI00273F13D9|nr:MULTISPECIES: NepR family anti-sigma factor [unclassified Roseitalea]
MTTANTNRAEKKGEDAADSGQGGDEAAVRKIGEKLRESYEEVVNAPVPDRFKALLDQLEQNEKPDDTG